MVANFNSLQHVARELGLAMEPQVQSPWTSTALLTGTVSGVPLEIEEWSSDFLHVYVRAYFTPAADLGLTLEPASLGAKIGTLLGFRDTQVGVASVDDAFVLHADEPERLAQLFTPAVTELLLKWREANVSFVVTDDHVELALPVAPLWGTGSLTQRDVHSAEDLLANVRATLGLASTLQTALRALPPSSLLAAHEETFRAYALACDSTYRAAPVQALRELAFSPSPLSISGTLAGCALSVQPRLARGAMTLTIKVGFGLPAVIRLRPRRIADIFARLRPSGGTVKTGDESMDELFTITVAQGSPALGWLTEPLRRGFVALQKEIGDVELDGHGLTLKTRALPDAAELPRLLGRLAELASGLRSAAGSA